MFVSTYSPLAASIVNPSNHNMVLHIDGRGDWYRCKITQIQDNKVIAHVCIYSCGVG